VERDPLRLAITESSVDKGRLTADHILLVDGGGSIIGGSPGRSRPSAETLLHLEVVRHTGAGAVFHTHSVWSTILSDYHAERSGLPIEGYEMLKGLEGVHTHEHREWLPIVENHQDMRVLAAAVMEALKEHRDAHGFLVRRHGLYTWGSDAEAAARHVEIFEFLLESTGRRQMMGLQP
jgi:methylthioribulose-1-phosphate dehydratase